MISDGDVRVISDWRSILCGVRAGTAQRSWSSVACCEVAVCSSDHQSQFMNLTSLSRPHPKTSILTAADSNRMGWGESMSGSCSNSCETDSSTADAMNNNFSRQHVQQSSSGLVCVDVDVSLLHCQKDQQSQIKGIDAGEMKTSDIHFEKSSKKVYSVVYQGLSIQNVEEYVQQSAKFQNRPSASFHSLFPLLSPSNPLNPFS